ncbi:Uncharacterized protein FKW44_005594, partial [Caligus rogercresseyi]
MMLVVVSSDGKKMPPYFFKPGEKVDTATYYKVLRTTYLTETIHEPKMVLHAIHLRRSKISAAPTCPISGRPTCGQLKPRPESVGLFCVE